MTRRLSLLLIHILLSVLMWNPADAASSPQIQPISASSLPLPTGASTDATLSTLSGKLPAAALLVDALANPTLTEIAVFMHGYNGTTWDRLRLDGSKNLLVNCSNCSGSGVSITDASAWTAGTSVFASSGGVFNDAATALTSGQQGTVRMTNNRALHINPRDASGAILFPTATALADAVANPTLTQFAGFLHGYNGTTWDRLRVNASHFLQASSPNLELAQGSTTSGQLGPLLQAAVLTAMPTYTTGQTSPLNLTLNGALRMDMTSCTGCSLDTITFTAGTSGASVIGGVFNDSIAALTSGQSGAARLTSARAMHVNPRDAAGGVLFPTGAALADATANPTISQIASFLHGYNGTTWDRLRLDGSKNLLVNCSNCSGSGVSATDSVAWTAGTTVFAPTGGVFNDSATALTSGQEGTVRLTTDRMMFGNVGKINGVVPLMGNGVSGTGSLRVNIASDNTAFAVNSTTMPGTSGGATTCVLQSAASTNATNCKGSAGQLYGYDLINTTATIYYLRLYNSATAPTCSSATGFVRTIPILSTGGISRDISVGEAYGTGISFCLTGGGTSTDNTNAATGVYITLHYK